MRGEGQRETLGRRGDSGLSRPSCLSGQESSLVSQAAHVPRDKDVTTTELRMLDRRMRRFRSGRGRVLPMDAAFAELDVRIVR